jgi:hypothetical protein
MRKIKPKRLSIAVLVATALCAQPLKAANDPQLQWGAVLRSNDIASTSGVTAPAAVKTNNAGEIFTFGTFSSHATAAYKYATYKHYDAAGALTEKATPTGALKETAGANPNLFFYKQDAQGKILWQVTSNWGDVVSAYSQIAPTSDGGALLVAKVRFTAGSEFAGDTLLQLVDNSNVKTALKWTTSTQNAYQIVAAKVSSSGQVQWLKHLVRVNDANGTDAIRVTGLEKGADGSFYLGGWYKDTITFSKVAGGTQRLAPHNSGGDLLLAKLDADGNLLWSVEATGTVASQSISSMVMHKNALFIYGNIQGAAGTPGSSSTLLGRTVAPTALEYNAYSARIDVGGATPTARWVALFNSRVQTNGKGGRIKVTNIDYDGESVFLSGSFTGFIDNAEGSALLANDTTGTLTAQLRAFIIRQDPYTGEVLGQVKDNATGISETYAVVLRGGKVHAYGYTMNASAWYRTYNADFTGETHHPLLAGGTAFDGVFLDSTLLALARGRNATSISGITGGITAEAPPAFSAYFLSFGIDSLRGKSLFEQLENAVDSVKALNPLSYTPASWAPLQAAVSAAEALLEEGMPSAQSAGEALAALRAAKSGVAPNNPEFQWGAVVRGSGSAVNNTQTIGVSADGSSVFTLGNFYTEKKGANGSTHATYKLYGADGNDTVATRTTPTGDLENAGVSSKINLLVYKLDKLTGAVQWQLTSDRGQLEVAYSQATPTADGGLMLALKLSFSGTVGGENADSILLRLVENDGVTKHAVKWKVPPTNARQVVMAKVDANGHVLWAKHVVKVSDVPISNSNAGQASDAIYVNGLEEDKDGNFYIAGRYVKDITFTKPDGSTQTFSPRNTADWTGDSQISRGDAFLAKLDPNGNLLWNLETGGTLYHQSVGAMTLAGDKLFIFGNAQATEGKVGVDYFAIQGDTIYPSAKTGAYAARIDVGDSAPTLRWLTLLNSRKQTNDKGGYIWTHNVDYDGGELLLTGRFTGFIDVDGEQVLANDVLTGASTASQQGYIMRLNPSTGKLSGAIKQGINGYYRAAFRQNRIYVFGYKLGQTFYHVYNPDFSGLAGQDLFSGGMATAWDAAFFDDDQLITLHRTRQANPFVNGIPAEHGLRLENAPAYSAYYTSHRLQGLQRQAENFRETLEDTIRAVRIAYADSTPYTAASYRVLGAALAAAGDTLARKAPVDGSATIAAIAAIRTAVSGLIPLDIGDLMAQLQEAVDSAKVGYPQETYTVQTWEALQEVIDSAEALLGAPAVDITEPKLTAAINDLASAVSKMVTRELDEARTALTALVDSAQGYEAVSYTAATHTPLEVAINAAQVLLAGSSATVAQLQAAGIGISTAINGLITKVFAAREALQDTIDAAKATYDTATYTVATYAALQDSLAAAQALLNDEEEHTVVELEGAAAGIAQAVGGLVTKVSAARTALQEAIDSTRASYVKASYTAASWAALQATIAAAEAALDDSQASYSDLATAASDLKAAIAGLVATPTGVSRIAENGLIVTAKPSTIVVRRAPVGAAIAVVNIVGSVIHRRIATGDVQEIAVSAGFYIVVVGSEAVKTLVE